MTNTPPTQDGEDRFRLVTCGYLSMIEAGIYVLLGLLLGVTAIVGVSGAVRILWQGMKDWTGTAEIFELIDRLLFVLMLIEILHTVRISIRSHVLVVEPFLIVGLIATIRRMLVLTLQAETYTTNQRWMQGGEQLFRASMIELGVLSIMIGVLVVSIRTMRRSRTVKGEEALAPFLPEDEE